MRPLRWRRFIPRLRVARPERTRFLDRGARLDTASFLDYVCSMTTTVTGKNQVTIPAELARELEIAPGTQLDWAKGRNGTLVVRIIPSRAELARRLAGRGRRYLRSGSDPIRALIHEREREDEQEGLR